MAEVASAYVSLMPSARGFGAATQQQVGGPLSRAGRKLGGLLSGAIGKAAKLGAAGVGIAAGAALAGGFKSALSQQDAEKVLTGLYGNANLAKKTLKGLADVSKTSPLDYSSYEKAAGNLAYAGVQGKDAIDILKNVGLAITAAGGNSQNLDSATNAILNMVNAGKVQLDTLQQLSNSGVPILSGLAAHFGTSISDVNKMASNGKIKLQDVLDVMQKSQGKTFKSMKRAGKAASGSFSNQWKIAKDNIVRTIGKALLPVIEAITPYIGKIGDAIAGFVPVAVSWFKKLGHFLSPIVGWVKGLFKSFTSGGASKARSVIGDLVDSVKNLVKAFKPFLGSAISGAFKMLRKAFELAWSAIRKMASVLKSVTGFLGNHTTVVGAFATAVFAGVAAFKAWTFAIKVWQAVTKIAIGVQAAFNAVMDANPIMRVVIAIAALVAGLIYAYKHSETFRNIVKAVFHAVAAAGKFMWNKVLKPAFDGLKAAFRLVGKAFRAVWNGFIKPVFDFIKSHFKIVLAVLTGGISVIITHWRDLWGVVKKLGGFIAGVFRAIGNGLRWAYNHTIKPVVGFITKLFKGFKHDIRVAAGLVSGAWKKIGDGLKWAYDHIIKPILGSIKTAIDAVKTAIDKIKSFGLGSVKFSDMFSPEQLRKLTPAQRRALGIGSNATGTDYWRGGLTMVGERGPELLNLPRGSQIIPHRAALAMMDAQPMVTARGGNTYNIYEVQTPEAVAAEIARREWLSAV